MTSLIIPSRSFPFVHHLISSWISSWPPPIPAPQRNTEACLPKHPMFAHIDLSHMQLGGAFEDVFVIFLAGIRSGKWSWNLTKKFSDGLEKKPPTRHRFGHDMRSYLVMHSCFQKMIHEEPEMRRIWQAILVDQTGGCGPPMGCWIQGGKCIVTSQNDKILKEGGVSKKPCCLWSTRPIKVLGKLQRVLKRLLF